MKKRNILLFSAIAAASITMAGCGFSAEDPADSQAVSITPEAEVTTPAPTATPAPTVTPAAGASGTDAAGTAAADGTTTDGTASDGSTSADSTSSDASAGTDSGSDTGASSTSTSSGDASASVGNSFTSFMDAYGTPIEYEPAYDANGNEVGGVYSYNDFSVTTDFTSGSEVVAAVDYY